jgi:hypothetical protein
VGSRLGGGATRGAHTAARGMASVPTRIAAIPAGRSANAFTPRTRTGPPTRVGATPAARPSSQPAQSVQPARRS